MLNVQDAMWKWTEFSNDEPKMTEMLRDPKNMYVFFIYKLNDRMQLKFLSRYNFNTNGDIETRVQGNINEEMTKDSLVKR